MFFNKFRIDSRWGEVLQQELQKFGINAFYYTSFYQHEDRLSSCSKTVAEKLSYTKLKPKRMRKMHYCSSNSRALMSVMDWFLSKQADKYTGFYRQPSWELEINSEDIQDPVQLRVREAYRHIGLRSSVIYEVPSLDGSGFMGFFELESELTNDALQFELTKNSHALKNLLANFHQRFNKEHSEILNPWTNTGIISTKSQKILQMLSEGITGAEVGEELYITRRGVDYHLDVLRSQFNVVNRNHLLTKACALNIVDTHSILFHDNQLAK